MPQPGLIERTGATRTANVLARRPRLVASLLVVVTLVALQGGAAAIDGEIWMATPGDMTQTNTGPTDDE